MASRVRSKSDIKNQIERKPAQFSDFAMIVEIEDFDPLERHLSAVLGHALPLPSGYDFVADDMDKAFIKGNFAEWLEKAFSHRSDLMRCPPSRYSVGIIDAGVRCE